MCGRWELEGNMTDLEKRILDLRKRYGDYLTQREFMEAAGISSRTAYLANKRGIVPYREEYAGSVRYYRIRAEDAARYMEARFHSQRMEGIAGKESVIGIILANEPDVLSIRHASMITGFHKNSIAKWIQCGYLRSFRWKGDYRISKAELVRYIASPRFWKARSKSLQREAIRMAMEWLEMQQTNNLIRRNKDDYENVNDKGSDR